MAKKLRFCILFLALGFVLFPKQDLFAATEISCCSADKEKSDCCTIETPNEKKQIPCHGSDEGQNTCTDCNTCGVCHFSVVLFATSLGDYEVSNQRISSKKQKFNYTTPEIFAVSKKIWQPPKIG